jgi:hypothetical protein
MKLVREVVGLILLAALCIAGEAAIRGSFPPLGFVLPVVIVFTIAAVCVIVAAQRSEQRALAQPEPH